IRQPVLTILSPTTGIRSMPTKACTLSSERICRIVAPSTASSSSRTAASTRVSCSLPALPPRSSRFSRERTDRTLACAGPGALVRRGAMRSCASLLAVAAGALVFGLVASSAPPPRVSFAIGLAPTAPDGFQGFGDAETMVAADVTGDGRLDLALGSAQDHAVWLALGTPAGGLATQRTEFPVGGVPSATAAGDLNGDGRPD